MRSSRESRLFLIVATVLACLGAAPLNAQGPPVENGNDPLLDTLNNEFRQQYKQALAATLAHEGPVIIEEGDSLILVNHGERTSVVVKPVGYHELKAVAHIPLALFVMLSFPQEASVPADRLESLRRYRGLMEKARATLPARHFTPEQLSRQEAIFSASFRLLDDVLATGHVQPDKLASYARQVGPLVLANVADATALEMHELYATAAALAETARPGGVGCPACGDDRPAHAA